MVRWPARLTLDQPLSVSDWCRWVLESDNARCGRETQGAAFRRCLADGVSRQHEFAVGCARARAERKESRRQEKGGGGGLVEALIEGQS
jgi:hypothetical protein